jgi:hypothetical protein
MLYPRSTDDEEIDDGDDDDDDDDDDDNDNDDNDGILESIQPVQVMLNKVCTCTLSADVSWHLSLSQVRKISFAVKNSSTLALPEWFNILDRLSLAPRMIPRDVKTQWNSMYDMLNVAVQYCIAINELTANQKFGLQDYEISTKDWKTTAQLCKVLQVSVTYSSHVMCSQSGAGFQECNNGLFKI